MVSKYQKAKKEISLFSWKEENNKSNIKGKMDPDQASNDKYLLWL